MIRRTVPYATLEQFEASPYSDEGHTVTQKILERASNKVDRMLRNAVYDVDATCIPTDPHVRAAIMEATCAQAAYFDEIGDVSGAFASGGGSLGPLTLPNRAGAAGSVTRAQMSQEAADILKVAGLLSSTIGGNTGQVVDKRPVLPEVPLVVTEG